MALPATSELPSSYLLTYPTDVYAREKCQKVKNIKFFESPKNRVAPPADTTMDDVSSNMARPMQYTLPVLLRNGLSIIVINELCLFG